MDQVRLEALSRRVAAATSRRGLLRVIMAGSAGVATAAVGLRQAPAKQRGGDKSIGPVHKLTRIRVTGEDGDQKFTGTLSVLEFTEGANGVVAVSRLRGTVTEANGNGRRRVSRTINVPVRFLDAPGIQAQAPCEILDLVLGPIDLRLLGLRLQVNRIHVRLTAEQGGGLLGDLLCAIANLLNGGGALSQIVGLLNQILAVLRSL